MRAAWLPVRSRPVSRLLALGAATLLLSAATSVQRAPLGSVAPVAPSAAGAASTAPTIGSELQAVQAAADLEFNGDPAAAEAAYAKVASTAAPGLVPLALVREARAALAAGRPVDAETVANQVRQSFPGSPWLGTALFLQARAREAEGNWPGALDALHALQAQPSASEFGPYVDLEVAACEKQLQDWPGVVRVAADALGRADASRLARIQAAEAGAAAALEQGDPKRALSFDSTALALAGTDSYRSEVLYSTGKLAREVGDTALAVDHFRAVVVSYASQPRALAALRALQEMGRATVVSPLQAGRVLLNAGHYAEAQDQLAQVPADSPDAAAAALDNALATAHTADTDTAVGALQGVAQSFPADAAQALDEAGQLREAQGQDVQADALYQQAASAAVPGAVRARALFRSGLMRYLGDDQAGALEAWQAAGDPANGGDASQRAEALLWQGKVVAQQQGLAAPAAVAAWRQAWSLAPDSYFGARAADLLQGITSPVMGRPGPALAVPPTTPSDAAAQQAWLGSLDTSPAAIVADVEANPSVQRAAALLDVGLPDAAGQEIDAALATSMAARDAAHLSGLADWLALHGAPRQSMLAAEQVQRIAGAGSPSLPLTVQKEIYPVPWGPLAQSTAQASGVDPLLLLALVRQESAFNPSAQSSAKALGLTQVMPATGQGIARTLGLGGSFKPSDLLNPGTSLRFGATYLGTLLKRYQGHLLPAIAAYNGGAGNVDRWLAAWGSDPDLFVEQIPFQETRRYVEAVYRNYSAYQRLYGG